MGALGKGPLRFWKTTPPSQDYLPLALCPSRSPTRWVSHLSPAGTHCRESRVARAWSSQRAVCHLTSFWLKGDWYRAGRKEEGKLVRGRRAASRCLPSPKWRDRRRQEPVRLPSLGIAVLRGPRPAGEDGSALQTFPAWGSWLRRERRPPRGAGPGQGRRVGIPRRSRVLGGQKGPKLPATCLPVARPSPSRESGRAGVSDCGVRLPAWGPHTPSLPRQEPLGAGGLLPAFSSRQPIQSRGDFVFFSFERT